MGKTVADLSLSDKQELERQLNQVTRVAQASRKHLQLFKVRPEPPRGVKLFEGQLVWESPRETRNVTHYNLYTPNDRTLFVRVPKGTAYWNGLMPASKLIFVSSYNEESGLESPLIQASGAGLLPGQGQEKPPGVHEAEPAPHVTGFALTKPPEYWTDDVGGKMFRLHGTFTPPASDNYTGARILGQAAGQSGWTILASVDAKTTEFFSGWMSVPTADTAWTVKVQEINADGKYNELDAETPTDTVTVLKGLGSLDLGRVLASTYETAIFGVDGTGHFYVKKLNLLQAFNFSTDEFDIQDPANGFQVIKALSAGKITTGKMKVGGKSATGGYDKPGQISIWRPNAGNNGEDMIGWIGETDDHGYTGAWFHSLWVGGSDPSTAPLIADNSGNLTIKGSGIYVGPGVSGGDGAIFVYNAAAIIGYIGTYGGDYGAWFKRLGIGGTDIASAKIKALEDGSVTITDAPLTITSGSVSVGVDVVGGFYGGTRGIGILDTSTNLASELGAEDVQLLQRSWNPGPGTWTYRPLVDISHDSVTGNGQLRVWGVMAGSPFTGVSLQSFVNYGKVTVSNNASAQIVLDASDGTINVASGYRKAGVLGQNASISYAKPGGGSGTLTFGGGILTAYT